MLLYPWKSISENTIQFLYLHKSPSLNYRVLQTELEETVVELTIKI